LIIAIFTNIHKDHAKPLAIGIREFLESNNVKVVTEDSSARSIGAHPLSSVKPKDVDFMISLGGDGTILRLLHNHPELEAPVLGINLGSLGFMTEITVENIYPSLENLLKGDYQVVDRLMMKGETLHNQKCFAVNEIVIHRAQNPSLIELAIYLDGNYLNTFAADGVIVATPNGSTAYSLAAGGPIMTPDLNAFVLTPISPHTISNRPIVLLPKHELQIRYISEYKDIEVSYDGFSHFTLHTGEVFRISPSERKFRLVTMPDYDYFSTLRTKLGWAGKLKK
jgi:NAD+ kinase